MHFAVSFIATPAVVQCCILSERGLPMGFIALIVVSPILIPILLIMLALGLRGRGYCVDIESGRNPFSDGMDDDDAIYGKDVDGDECMFYGEIPMGDSTLYLTDDDDICEEFRDEVDYDFCDEVDETIYDDDIGDEFWE